MKAALTSVQVQNFKAVEDTGKLGLDRLTVFIGDNGVGKSSVLEALRFVATLASRGLVPALEPSGGYEHLRWKGGKRRGQVSPGVALKEHHSLEIALKGHHKEGAVRATVRLSGQNQNEVVIERETLTQRSLSHTRDERGIVSLKSTGEIERQLLPARSLLSDTGWFDDWQFLDMVPGSMGQPKQFVRTGSAVRLLPGGENLSEYLLDLKETSQRAGLMAFEGFLETLQVILPYAADVELQISDMMERRVALQLGERHGQTKFKVPGWMLSTGTLRLMGLLALLRHPSPPSLICVEEIENGLDPRTIHLLVSEILRATENERTQVMLTTHSPYLLDLLPLSSLVLVSREPGGSPSFRRPGDDEAMAAWSRRFAPGALYTMGALSQGGGS